jgi:hypothetical protein
VRVWYNTQDGCRGGVLDNVASPSAHSNEFPFPTCSHTGRFGSRLSVERVRVISSVIEVVDAEQVKSLNMGQLADYVVMAGLAQINFGGNPGPRATILHLFSGADEPRPQGLSLWDRAFLKALYNTYPDSVLQVSQIESKMLAYIERQ